MKKHTLVVLSGLLLVLFSLGWDKKEACNTNSWSIGIGKKDLLASWRNNRMGDTALVYVAKIKETDSLVVQRYLCGYSAKGANTTLLIQNGQGQVITETVNTQNTAIFSAKMPWSKIKASKNFKHDNVLRIYFQIESKSQGVNELSMLGILKIK